MILNEANKTLGLLHKLNNILPRPALLNVYEGFFRPLLEQRYLRPSFQCNFSSEI